MACNVSAHAIAWNATHIQMQTHTPLTHEKALLASYDEIVSDAEIQLRLPGRINSSTEI